MKEFNLEAYLKDVEYLVNIDSGSHNVAGISTVADFFTKRFEDLGWSVKRHNFRDDLGPTLEIRNGDFDEIDVLLVGHMDTVFPDGTVAERPFKIEDGKAYGPGAGDMKNGLTLMQYIASELTELGGLGLNVCIVMNGDEEISSQGSKVLLTELAKKSSTCFVYESGRSGGKLVNKRKGLAKYVVEFTGKAAHAGVAPQDGASAIHEMANWIPQLVKLNQYEIGTSLNVGVVKGGTVPNVVAASAYMEIDTRFELLEEQQKIERTLSYLEKNISVAGVTAKVEMKGSRPPMNPSAETECLMAVVEAVGAKIGFDVGWVATGGGSDANFTAAAGCPSLDGMGPFGGDAHTDHEWFVVDRVEPSFRLSMEVLAALSENKKENGGKIVL